MHSIYIVFETNYSKGLIQLYYSLGVKRNPLSELMVQDNLSNTAIQRNRDI